MSKKQDFAQTLKKVASPYYQKILQSEFIRGILAGTLPKARFCQYLRQDALYLGKEAELLNQLSHKCHLKEESDFFLSLSQDCFAIETQMQEGFFSDFAISPASSSQGIFAKYLKFLQKQLSWPFALSIFAYFPCYYLYAILGKALSASAQTSDNIYQSYLDTYAGEPYKKFVDRYSKILQKYFQQFSSAEKNRALILFGTACKFESQIFQEA